MYIYLFFLICFFFFFFQGLNSENSKNNKNNLDSKQSIWQNNSTQKIDDKNSISNKKDNGKSTGKNKEKDVEDLDFSQSISDSADLDFSVSETEISGSKSGIDNNKDNYDFTAAVIPPKGKPGPRDRTATGWQMDWYWMCSYVGGGYMGVVGGWVVGGWIVDNLFQQYWVVKDNRQVDGR